jgi:N-acetylmuramate 1-kinase
VNSPQNKATSLNPGAREFLGATAWASSDVELLAGDASARRYFRLHCNQKSAVLMDASREPASVAPYVLLSRHLDHLGFSAPAILELDEQSGLLLLEDFGDNTFARLLEKPGDSEGLFALATDVLIALHEHPGAIPKGLRTYHPERMLDDIELFLQWRTPAVSDGGKAEFRTVWREVLPAAHQVPASLLLRDYHAGNLMLLSERDGIRRAGLLDFQDAYQGPVAYDLMSLLEDARRDVPPGLRQKMVNRYLAHFPGLDKTAFETSMAVLAAQRHLRVLAIFERLSRRDGKHEYKRLHSARVEAMLQRALRHPMLAGVKQWLERYARKD